MQCSDRGSKNALLSTHPGTNRVNRIRKSGLSAEQRLYVREALEASNFATKEDLERKANVSDVNASLLLKVNK